MARPAHDSTAVPRDSASESTPEWASRLADALVRRRAAILLVTLALSALALWRASKLELRTSFAELLPEKDPAVVLMKELSSRIKDRSMAVIVVEGPSPAANQRFVDDAVARLRALDLPEIRHVEWGVREQRQFFERYKFLYASEKELREAHRALEEEIARRKNPLLVDLDEGDGDELARHERKIERRERELFERFPDDYFRTRDGRLYVIIVRAASSMFREGGGEALIRTIQTTLNALSPARYHPALTFGITGDIVTALEERQALEDDLVVATSLCVALVCLSIFLFYGRLWAIPFAVIPAILGFILAMAFAELAFGYLNASTAFMGSIIVGNGINYAIIQMARYEEERRRRRSVRDAIATTLATTWRPTVLAALGAAIAYGSLAVTNFRGFNQFGYIGGVGMLLSWLFTVAVLPALWALLDRRSAEISVPRVRGFKSAAPIARFVVSHPMALLGLAAILTVLACIPLPEYLKDPFEYDFRNLRNQVSRQSGSGQLSGKVDRIFGRAFSGSPNVVLADRVDDVEAIRAALEQKNERYNVLGTIRTINDVLPGRPAEQREKLALLARIRALIDKNANLVKSGERDRLKRLRPPDDLSVLRPVDLPLSLRRFYTEADGTIGRPVIYYPREKGASMWNGRNLIKLAEVTQTLKLPDGRTVRSSGSAAVFAGMLRAITEDGPIATAVAFLGVVLLVSALTWRRGGTWLVLGVLLVGVLWTVGAAAAWNVRINFLNFVALPITFGIGVDYGINLYLRYRHEGQGGVRAAVETTGGAVALCSLTTIIGYAALLVADNRALQSFGGLAILGEFACLLAALVIMPATLLWLEPGGMQMTQRKDVIS